MEVAVTWKHEPQVCVAAAGEAENKDRDTQENIRIKRMEA
jgi:hypothetical protein